MGSRYDILDKRCIVFSEKKNGMYCTKCGQRLIDHYSAKKHGSICGFSKEDFDTDYIFKAGKTPAYSLQILNHPTNGEKYLEFRVYFPVLLLPREGGKSYKGHRGSWKKVYACCCNLDGKIVEQGAGNLLYWLERIEEKNHLHYQDMEPRKIIATWADSVPLIWDMRMFFFILINKGYRNHSQKMTRKDAKEIIGLYSGKQDDIFMDYTTNCNVITVGRIIDWHNSKTMLYDFYSSKDRFTKVIGSLVVAEKFLYTDIMLSKEDKILELYPKGTDMMTFVKSCPSYVMESYLKAGGNRFFKALVSCNYHPVIEKAVKSGLASMGDRYESKYAPLVENQYTNKSIPKTFGGIPTKVLFRYRSLLEGAWGKPVFEMMKKVYKAHPNYFNAVPEEAGLVLRLLLLQHDFSLPQSQMCTLRGGRIPYAFLGTLSEKDVVKMIRYLCQIKRFGKEIDNECAADETYHLYCDYLTMYYEITKVYPEYKVKKLLTPDGLRYAHDKMMRVYREKVQVPKENASFFEEKYMAFASDYYVEGSLTEKEEKAFAQLQEQPYMIVVPSSSRQISREGMAMHNCVASYIPRVVSKSCYILFLREKENPSKSFCTIEVSKDRKLIQCKAPCNTKPSRNVRDYMKKYCLFKKIDYTRCWDLR